MSTTQRAVIYTRVSTRAQEEHGTSLATQLAGQRAYCQQHGYIIAGEFSDTFTRKKHRERDGLNQLREMVRAGRVDVVVGYDVDRTFGSPAQLYIVLEEVTEYKARLEFALQTFEDTAVGRFLLGTMAFVAEVEREKIIERTTRGRRGRAELLGKLLPGSHPPFGYRWPDEADQRKRHAENGSHPYEAHAWLVPDETTAPMLKRMFKDAAQGETLRGIAHRLTAESVPTPRGHLTGNPVWEHTSVRAILKNRLYLGEATSHGDIRLPDDLVPALVDGTTFEQVQHRLSVNRQRAKRNARYPDDVALLRGGLAVCGLCGATLTVKRNEHRARPGTFDYSCPKGRAGRCGCHGMRTTLLDGELWEQVRAFFLSDTSLSGGGEGLGLLPPEADLKAIERALASTERQHGNIARRIALTDDDDSVAVLLATLDSLSARRRELEAEREAVTRQAKRVEERRQILAGLDAWRALTAKTLDVLTFAERRKLLDLMGLKLKLYPMSRSPRWEAENDLVPSIVLSAP